VPNLAGLIKSGDYGGLEVVANALKVVLTPRQEKVLRLSFGLGCARGHSVQEIASEFDASKERIYRVRRQALEVLRKFGIGPESLKLAVDLEVRLRQQPLVFTSPEAGWILWLAEWD